MPRSARHQASIDRHRTTLALPPKPKDGIKCPESWWAEPMSTEEFSATAKGRLPHMRPHETVIGDRGGIS